MRNRERVTMKQDRNQLLIGVGFGSGLLLGLAAYLSARKGFSQTYRRVAGGG